MNQKFSNILEVQEAQFSNSGWFYLGCEDDKPHRTTRCWVCLILSDCYTPHLPLWLGTHGFGPSLIIKILATTFLEPFGYYTVINCVYTFHTTNAFSCICGVMAQFKFLNHKFPNWNMFICTLFKSHIQWSNAQRVSPPTTSILPTTAGTYHGSNCFCHMINTPQISMFYQNIAKLLTHSSIKNIQKEKWF